ncbi:MAG: YCF48-related protein [Desulfobacterales bacterium]|jgi:photosystem II stability/assembly factor-like uncharacterized protein|nr:YCF48-related protein [Desulfobacterales bacterium]
MRVMTCRRIQWLLYAGVALTMIWGDPAAALESESESAEIMPLAARSLLLDGVMLKSGRCVVVGERGHILYSDDQGESWHQVAVPTRATLTSVAFHDDATGWAAGHDAVILMTRDGAKTWEKLRDAPKEEKPILDLWCVDSQNGFAVGAYGLFLQTNDGGNTWRPHVIIEEDRHLNQVAAASNGKFYIAAEAGLALRSVDAGQTWQDIRAPYEGSFFGLLPLAHDTVLLFGLRGHLFRSEDAGDAWEKIETGTEAMLNAGVRLSDGRIVIAGNEGTLIVSRDEGLSFTLHPQADRKGISCLVPTQDNHLLLFGEGGAKKIPVTFD